MRTNRLVAPIALNARPALAAAAVLIACRPVSTADVTHTGPAAEQIGRLETVKAVGARCAAARRLLVPVAIAIVVASGRRRASGIAERRRSESDVRLAHALSTVEIAETQSALRSGRVAVALVTSESVVARQAKEERSAVVARTTLDALLAVAQLAAMRLLAAAPRRGDAY